jgi:hypothetical protein
MEEVRNMQKILMGKIFSKNANGRDGTKVLRSTQDDASYAWQINEIRPETRKIMGFFFYIRALLPSCEFSAILPHSEYLQKTTLPIKQDLESSKTDNKFCTRSTNTVWQIQKKILPTTDH